jgi:flagellar FliL protein
MAVQDQQDTDVASKKGGPLKFILIGVAAVTLMVAGMFGGPLVKGMLGGDEAAVEEGAAADAGAQGASAGTLASLEQDEPALYQGIHPPLLINFMDARGKSRFLQISLELMTREQRVVDAIKNHNAVIRNNLILLYGDIDYETVTTREGKEQMLADALAEVRQILLERIGDEGVEDVYFTNLVVQ